MTREIDSEVQKIVDQITVQYADKWAKETTSKLELMALRAFPSSPVQLAIRQEINRRVKSNIETEIDDMVKRFPKTLAYLTGR